MNVINKKEVVQKQYENAENLNTRISIHEKYSVNNQGFGNWIVSHYQITEKMRILELGCGTGDMWKNNLKLLNQCSELVLTDFSNGILETACNNIGKYPNVNIKLLIFKIFHLNQVVSTL